MIMKWDREIEELVRKFASLWSRRLGFGREDAEDFEQEAVCSLYLKVSDGKVVGRHGTWFAVRNLAFDYRRRLSREVDRALWEDREGSYTIEGLVMSRLQLAEIEREFPELVAFAEAREAGYSWEDIGSAFGEPPTTLRVKWLRLCQKVCQEIVKELSQIDNPDRL